MVFLIAPKEHSAYSFAIRMQFIVMDINSLASSWFLLLTSTSIRRAIFRLITCGECKPNIVFVKKATSSLCEGRRKVQPSAVVIQPIGPASQPQLSSI